MAFTFLKILDAKESRSETVSFVAKVLSIGKIEQYSNKEGDTRKYCTMTVADDEQCTIVRNYQTRNVETLHQNQTYAFTTVVKKDGVCPFWVISTSQIIPWANIDIPANIIEQSKNASTSTAPNSERNMAEALACGSTSTICGKSVQTSPTKFVRAGSLPLKHLGLKDRIGSPTISVALFGRDAEMTYSEGDTVQITNVYRYKNTTTLSTKPSSSIQFLPPDTLDITITDQDKLDNDEFMADPPVPPQIEFTVMGVKSAYIYDACTKPTCKNKKLKSGKCPICGSSAIGKYANMKLIVSHEQLFTENTLFLPEMTKLLTLPSLDSFNDNHELLSFISQQLPINGRGMFAPDGKMTIQTTKRPNPD